MKAVFILTIAAILCFQATKIYGQAPNTLTVHKSGDFNITGNGSDSGWNKAEWITISKLDSGGVNYDTKFKILYSSKGIYLLFTGDDHAITTSYDKDFGDLYQGDVFEAFFHPDTSFHIYLEYEVNQLNKELVLLVLNLKGKSNAWLPMHYENEKKVKKMVSITGGKAASGASIIAWSAELFFPYGLFSPLGNVPPSSGTVWRANFYRLDYDSGNMIKWAWSPVMRSFHEFEKFGFIKFE